MLWREFNFVGFRKYGLSCFKGSRNSIQKNILCTVVNLRFLKPLDIDLIQRLIKETKDAKIFTLEENVLTGGLGSAVRENLKNTSIEINSIGLPDTFIEQGDVKFLRDKYNLSGEKIAQRIQQSL